MFSHPPLTGRKIVIVGCSGSGKVPSPDFPSLTQSTLGEQLAQNFSLPFLCLDALSHQPHWQDTPPDVFRNQVLDFVAANPHGWVIDGNYTKTVRDITWASASDIIWLDFPIFVVLWRLWFRTIERIRSGVKLWGMEGCVETWQVQFFSRKSLLYHLLSVGADESLWVFWFYWYRRPVFYRYLVGKEKGSLEGINVIWFRWPSKTQAWLAELEDSTKLSSKKSK